MLSAFSGKDTENGYMLLIRSYSVRQSPLLALTFFDPYLIIISAYEVSQLCMVTVLGYKASVCLKPLKTNKWETFSVLKPLSPYTLIQSLSPLLIWGSTSLKVSAMVGNAFAHLWWYCKNNLGPSEMGGWDTSCSQAICPPNMILIEYGPSSRTWGCALMRGIVPFSIYHQTSHSSNVRTSRHQQAL